MANSLLKTILLQTDKARVRIQDQVSLNTELQKKAGGGLLDLYRLVGGLGSAYKDLAPFLTVDDGVITELNVTELLQFAHSTLLRAFENGNKKRMYKAGICFALVAVYADEPSSQLNAYKQLCILFKEKKYLANIEMQQRCERNMHYWTPGDLSHFFIPHREITWSWAIQSGQEAQAVIQFEKKRHELIIGNSETYSIAQAFLLLGLTDRIDLKAADINDAYKSFEAQLKKYARIAPSEVSKHLFINNFKKAELVLEHYIRLKNFDTKEDFKNLENKLKDAEKAAISNEAAFFAANDLLCRLDVKLRAVTEKLIQDKLSGRAAESPYTTESMIKDRLGDYVDTNMGRTFEVQVRLDAQAKLYWDSFWTKLIPLIQSAIILNSKNITTALVTDIQQLCSQIEHALSIVDAIKGDALSESSVVTAVATNIDTVCNLLNESLDKLKKKIAIHDQNIKDTVKNIVELNQKAGKEEEVSLEGEEPNKLIIHCKSMMALTKEYSHWLATLDPRSKSIAEKEFQLYIISQASIESVIDPLCTMLNKVPLKNLKVALKSFMGTKYNDRLPLKDVLTTYFKIKKEENLQALIVAFVSEIKALVNEQSDIKADITGKDLVPPASYRTFEFAVQSLTANEAKLTAKSEQLINKLNNELQTAIEPLLERYKVASRDMTNLLAEKNSLNFSWKKNVAALFSCQKLLEEDYKKIEVLFQNKVYLTPEVLTLVTNLQRANSEFNEEFDTMASEVGDTGLDTLKYLILKNRIKHEKALYLAQGGHHPDRHDSLQRLSEKYEELEGKNTSTRFADLLEAIVREKAQTGISHKRIGFLGGLRPCRLQKTYSKLIDESTNLTAIYSRLWEQSELNLDSMKYIALKQRIQQERELYLAKGTHHKERYASLQRLEEQIGLLDSDESNEENRFSALLDAVYKEAMATDSSQKKIGFFGGLMECRLQKTYKKIIDDALVFDSAAAESTYDVDSEDDTFSLSL